MTFRIYPSQASLTAYPCLSGLGEVGIMQSISWSITDMGPHFRFDFSELGNEELEPIDVSGPKSQIRIGQYANEAALGTTHYFITMDDSNEIWMSLQKPTSNVSPIFLASSPQKLVAVVDRFAAHLEALERSIQEEEWERDWKAFLNDCRMIDKKRGASYWASLAMDYLEHD